LDQLSLLGQRISMSLVQELVSYAAVLSQYCFFLNNVQH
jgi:hypothetical protein